MHGVVQSRAEFDTSYPIRAPPASYISVTSSTLWGPQPVIHFPPDSSQLFKNCRPSVHHFSASSVPGTVVFCSGGGRRTSHQGPLPACFTSFCSNNPAHNSYIERTSPEHSLLLKFEIRDTHLTDYNSTLTDKDCRRGVLLPLVLGPSTPPPLHLLSSPVDETNCGLLYIQLCCYMLFNMSLNAALSRKDKGAVTSVRCLVNRTTK
ncbi:hypothetical protein Zmor_010654 [Zophobas morio]|uniref:Uncharacterized protein n=1 Tax=Zophobas morio TaxID=2755281 RepID=A0AA38MK41_9CUCU|nr:hypothetical protein Zmor_010654 [Zophobas morio]